MDDFISREAAYKTLTEYYHHSSGVQHTVLREALNRVPTADVRPVAEISDAVDEVLDFLNENYNRMPYHIYSELFDLVCGICPHCGADMREPNLDATKGDGYD